MFRSGALSIREAVRGLARQKTISGIAVFTLTLGISMSAAMLCVVYGVMLRPLSYDGDRRLAVAWAGYEGALTERESFSEQALMQWRTASRTLDGLAGFRYAQFTLLERGEPIDLQGAQVSPEFFTVLGVRAAVGTTFNAQSARGDHGKVVLLSHRLWRQRFSGNLTVVGQHVNLGGEIFTVSGVMPSDFDVPSQNVALWTPLPIYSLNTAAGTARTLMVIARLRPSATLAQAESDAAGTAHRLAGEYADTHRGMRIHLVPFVDELTRESRPLLTVGSIAAWLVLFICAANVSHLLLMRTVVKRPEFATRVALGAPLTHVMGVVLAESLVLAVCSGIVGGVLARWMIAMLVRWAPVDLPRASALGHGMQVPVVAGMSTVVAALLVSAPALWEVGRRMRRWHASSGGRTTSRRLAGQLVVAVQIATALTLVAGAGLMARTLLALREANPGWKTDHLLAAQISLPAFNYREPQQAKQFYETFIERLRETPGAVSVAASSALPAEPMGLDVELPIEVPGHSVQGQSSIRLVSPGLFRTLGIPMLQGRDLEERDGDSRLRRIVVNRAFVKKHLPDSTSVIGTRVIVPLATRETYEIVGEVGDVHHYGMLREPRPELYLPFASWPINNMGIVVRTAGNPQAFAAAFRTQLRALDAALPVASTKTMVDMVSDTWSDRTFLAALIAGFAAVVVVSTIMGVFSVMTYAVSRRQRELAIHMAVGARPGEVIRLVMGDAVRLIAVGLVMGLVGALVFGQSLRSLIYGVDASDPRVFLVGILIVVAVAGIGAYAPSRRAASVDPLIALRVE
jgi:putative ABC transport system permease protein